MGGFARFLADHLMLASIYDRWIRFPKVAKRPAFSVIFRDQIPKSPTSFFWPIPDVKRNDLPRPSAKCYPNPSFLYFFTHKWPQLVQFEYIIFFGWNQRAYDSREGLCFFLSNGGLFGGWCRTLCPNHGKKCVLGPPAQPFFWTPHFYAHFEKHPQNHTLCTCTSGFQNYSNHFLRYVPNHIYDNIFFQLPWPVFFWTKLSKTPTKLHYQII